MTGVTSDAAPGPVVASATNAAGTFVKSPIAPTRYLLRLTIGQDTHDKLTQARALLRHAVPDGDLATIVDRALTLLLRDAERTKHAAVSRPRPAQRETKPGRSVPAGVKRAVWSRDEGRCAFRAPEGRCGEAGFLEFHHVVPFAMGGATTESNLELRCRAHNAYESTQFSDAGSGP